MKDVAIITVTYKDSTEKLKELIQMFKGQGVSVKSIFVKDNTFQNVGYGPAINSILKKQLKHFKFFFIVNPDIKLERNCLNVLLNTIKLDKKIGIVGPRTVDNRGEYIDGGSIDKKRYSSILSYKKGLGNDKIAHDVVYVTGSAMLIRREVFQKTGLFREDYFIYYEEVDFCFRAVKKGFRLVVNPQAKVFHAQSETVGKSSPAMHYYMARNHLIFVERFAPLKVKLRELIRIPKTIYEARERPFELLGVKDYFLRQFGRNKQVFNKIDL